VTASALTGKEFSPADFMPRHEMDTEEQTPEQIIAKLKALQMLIGGKTNGQ
jgi:hypothetical protein